MTEYIKNPLSGKLRGVTYEDGKIIDVHIRDTDDVVKVFVPVRHGRWMKKHDAVMYWRQCSECGNIMTRNFYGNEWNSPYCPNCGAKMDGDNND